MFTVNYVLLYVLMKFCFELTEDGDNSAICRSKVMERINRIWNCAFFGVNGILTYQNAQNEQRQTDMTVML